MKNYKKNMIENKKSEKFFLKVEIQTRYNCIDKRIKAYLPNQLFEQLNIFTNLHIPPYLKGGNQLCLKSWSGA